MGLIKKITNSSILKYGLLFTLAFVIFSLGGMILWVSTLKMPHLDSFEDRIVDQSVKIYARDGETLLFDIFENARRTLVPFEEISENIKNATLAVEDSEFYEHNGVQLKSIIRAVFVNLKTGNFTQGGSTITQQVVKNSVLTPEKLISRKLKEWIFSIRLEQTMEKDKIFEFYLNETPYGGTIYGVEQASRSFFGKSASDVGIAEAAYLAALPVSPTRLSPYGKNRELLDQRKNFVLSEMYDQGLITKDEYEEARGKEVKFLSKEDGNIRAPHFVMYVQSYIEEKYGLDIWDQEGVRIITTLDHEMQEKAEELALEHALRNKENFNAENIALTAIDPKTGEILVMVGSRDYSDPEIDGNYNIATSKRQPGSVFKPFAYAQAFKKGYTPETILFDLKTQFSTSCSPDNLSHKNPCYSPQNYDGVFKGPVTMRDALAQSINIPAIKTLYLAGLKETAELARSMGLENIKNVDRYGLTMVLGGGEVSLLNVTSAYGVFAYEGIRTPHSPILKIENSDGEIIENNEPKKERVLDRNVALTISDILSDNRARTPAFGANSLLYFENHDVAVKTGTTNDYKDAWIVGYTPNIVIGAWAGNNDNTSMDRRISSFIITPFWRDFTDSFLEEFSSSFKKVQIENTSELKPVLRGVWNVGSYEEKEEDNNTEEENNNDQSEESSENTEDLVEEENDNNEDEDEEKEEETVFRSRIHSILHWVKKENPRGEIPSNPKNDPQYIYWEYPVREWAEKQGF